MALAAAGAAQWPDGPAQDYESRKQDYLAAVSRAKFGHGAKKAEASRKLSQEPKPDVGPVMVLMEQVVADLLAGHGCRHGIGCIERLREQLDSILHELRDINVADERVQLKRLVSLRQAFIVLNTTAVVQSNRTTWEFQSIHGMHSQRSAPVMGASSQSIRSEASLPDIGDSSCTSAGSVFERLQKPAEKEMSDSSRLEEQRKEVEVQKGLRRLLRNRENQVQEKKQLVQQRETQWQQALEVNSSQSNQIEDLRAKVASYKRQLATLTRELAESQEFARTSEEDGRAEAQAELKQTRKQATQHENQLTQLRKALRKHKSQVANHA